MGKQLVLSLGKQKKKHFVSHVDQRKLAGCTTSLEPLKVDGMERKREDDTYYLPCKPNGLHENKSIHGFTVRRKRFNPNYAQGSSRARSWAQGDG